VINHDLFKLPNRSMSHPECAATIDSRQHPHETPARQNPQEHYAMPENDLLQTFAQTLLAHEFDYLDQFFAALLPMFLTVVFHGLGMDAVRRVFKRFGTPLLDRPNVAGRAIVMSLLVCIMLLAHLSGVAIWAVFYLIFDLLPNAKDAMLYSIQSYTTLGSSIAIKGSWVGFGGFEAAAGMLMFGWSTAVLATVAQKFHSIDD
jgi:hypothetical protein